jgi:hypothetical protein
LLRFSPSQSRCPDLSVGRFEASHSVILVNHRFSESSMGRFEVSQGPYGTARVKWVRIQQRQGLQSKMGQGDTWDGKKEMEVYVLSISSR